VGVIYPDDTWVDKDILDYLQEFRRFLPPEVEMPSAHQYVRARDTTVEEGIWLAESPDIEVAAERLMRFEPQCIAHMCTTTSFIKGVGHDRDISDRIEKVTGVPALTTSTAVLEALRTLRATKVATAAPYLADVNQRLTEFLEGNGFSVVSSNPLGLARDHNLNPADNIRRAAEETDRPEAEAVLIACTGQKTAGFISDLEEQLGKPVVTANQATMWYALRMVGVDPKLPGLGILYGG
jgi:maleate isomerase